MAIDGNGLAPVAGKARIDVIDILRGVAILGIFFMNVPFMGGKTWLFLNDIRSIGWTVVDRNSWAVIAVIWEGTQRGLLEFLFGAGMMVLTAKAMTPDGPVAVADLYYRRNYWLIAFGLFDIFVLLWAGDILLVYGLAALFLFPFRKLAAKWLVAIGLLWAAFTLVGGTLDYVERADLRQQVEQAQAKKAAGTPLGAAETKALAEWQKKVDGLKLDADEKKWADREQKAHDGSFFDYVTFNWDVWLFLQSKAFGHFTVIEAFCAMLIGVALWKWRIIQGGRSARFYLVMALTAYGFGLTARAVGVAEVFAFAPFPKTIWATNELARLAVTLGHVALVNLIVKSVRGATLLAPFKAAGKTAFSLYFMQQITGMYVLFSPFGFDLWGQYSWAGLAIIAALVILGQLIIANLWMRLFVAGPLEWLWRSLAYVRWQPFMRFKVADPTPVPA